jgi:hypothetical protein
MEAIPAVSPRLIDLLAHNSCVFLLHMPNPTACCELMRLCRPHVKTKTMGVIRRIGLDEPDILSSARDKVLLRLKDQDSDVVGAALGLLGDLAQVRPPIYR